MAVLAGLFPPALLVSAVGALVFVTREIVTVQAGQKATDLKVEEGNTKLNTKVDKLDTKVDKLEEGNTKLNTKLDEVLLEIRSSAKVASRTTLSVVEGVKEVEAKLPLKALAYWSQKEVADYFDKIGFLQYASAISPIAGVGLVGVTDARLEALGVHVREHREIILLKVEALVQR